MRISILTLFPDMFQSPFAQSIVGRAIAKKMVTISYVNMRDYADDAYKTVDGRPYGGGQGMVLKVDIMDNALSNVKSQKSKVKSKERVILLDPRGKPFTQKKAASLSKLDHLILICGHYEGVDERIRSLVDEEISIGDYILTGGEIPAMAVSDAVIRLIPGVLKDPDATRIESFSPSFSDNHTKRSTLLEYPQYTRPETYKGMNVPKVLLSGNHKEIETWRRNMAKSLTRKHRPDLLEKTITG